MFPDARGPPADPSLNRNGVALERNAVVTVLAVT